MHISLSEIDHCNSKLSKNTQFEKILIYLFSFFNISENLQKNPNSKAVFWKDCTFPVTFMLTKNFQKPLNESLPWRRLSVLFSKILFLPFTHAAIKQWFGDKIRSSKLLLELQRSVSRLPRNHSKPLTHIHMSTQCHKIFPFTHFCF